MQQTNSLAGEKMDYACQPVANGEGRVVAILHSRATMEVGARLNIVHAVGGGRHAKTAN